MANPHRFDGALQRVEQLREHYDAPMEVALRKDIGRIDELCRRLIAAAPMVFVATFSRDGRCDVSPRGGAGAGLAFPALMTLSMSGATPSDSGLASGLVNTTLQVGGAIGLAVATTFATERTEGLLADGESTASALTSGYHLAYLIGAGLVAVALVIVLTVMRPPRQTAAQQAEG
jgi:hypothetical protein